MSRPHVFIVTPAAAGSRAGNRNTATRWSRILRACGIRVTVATRWSNQGCDLLVALHARRSHDSLAAYRDAHPLRPAVLVLTGTDIYRDIRHDERANNSLALADRLVVLQDQAPSELDDGQRLRTRVIYQSVTERHPWRPPRRQFRVCVLGHLRQEKDPLRAAMALRLLPNDRPTTLLQAGAALDAELADQARTLMAADARYRWVGELAHWRALRLLAGSHAMVISSHIEGGAHVVSEAIASGVPVIASDIPGNRGMLGDAYPGYYRPGDEFALSQRLAAAMADRDALEALRAAVASRRPLIAPERERAALLALLAELAIFPSENQPTEHGDGNGGQA